MLRHRHRSGVLREQVVAPVLPVSALASVTRSCPFPDLDRSWYDDEQWARSRRVEVGRSLR